MPSNLSQTVTILASYQKFWPAILSNLSSKIYLHTTVSIKLSIQIWVQNVGCECILGNHLRYLILLVSSRNLHFSCPKKIVMAILGSDAVRSRVFWLNCSEFFNRKGHTSVYNGILFPKLFWPTVRKSCSSDQEKLLDSRLKAKNLQKKIEIST